MCGCHSLGWGIIPAKQYAAMPHESALSRAVLRVDFPEVMMCMGTDSAVSARVVIGSSRMDLASIMVNCTKHP